MIMDLLDNPVIRNMERTGYLDGREPPVPVCPICGEECETVYKTQDDEIIGCDLCLQPVDAWDCSKCFPHYERSFLDD